MWVPIEQWPALHEVLVRALTAASVPAADLDDVLQETALRLCQSGRASIDPDGSVEAFARAIARNVGRDLCRQRAGRVLSPDLPEHTAAQTDT